MVGVWFELVRLRYLKLDLGSLELGASLLHQPSVLTLCRFGLDLFVMETSLARLGSCN